MTHPRVWCVSKKIIKTPKCPAYFSPSCHIWSPISSMRGMLQAFASAPRFHTYLPQAQQDLRRGHSCGVAANLRLLNLGYIEVRLKAQIRNFDVRNYRNYPHIKPTRCGGFCSQSPLGSGPISRQASQNTQSQSLPLTQGRSAKSHATS